MTFRLASARQPGLEREVSSASVESDAVANTLALVLRRVCETVGWDLGQAWLPDDDERALQISPIWHGDSIAFEPLRAALSKGSIKRGGGLVGCAWSTRKAQWFGTTTNGNSSTRLGWSREAWANRDGLRTGLAVPVVVDKRVTIVLEFWTREERAPDARMTLFIAALASQLQKTIAHEQNVEARHRSEEWFRAAMESSLAAFWILQCERDAQGTICDFRFLFTNARGEELLRLPRQKIVGSRLSQVVAPEIAVEFVARYAKVAQSQQGREGEWQIARLSKKRASGEKSDLWIRSQIVPLQDGVAVTTQDISSRKIFEQSLRESEDHFRNLIENASDVITILESDGEIRYQSASLERTLGFKPEELVGTNAFSWVHPEDTHRVLEMANEVRLQPGTSAPVVFRMRHKDGSWRWLEALANNLLHRPEISGLVVNSRDISERVAYEERIKAQQRELKAANRKLKTLATTDGLTHLYNHRTFQRRLEDEIARAQRHKLPLSLAVLDIDKFKSYNDSFGHLIGDRVLVGVARLLKHTARRDDFTARYGGEEFVILMPNTNAKGALEVAERVRLAAETAKWKHRPLTISIGLATLGEATSALADLDPASPSPEARTVKTPKSSARKTVTQSDLFFAQADDALYASKRQGRNRVTHHRDLA